ncbi:nickel-responsive transcriptional regulator NikR [Exilibacterium tricleocarpae]|uniref:Putative nickel-responsive regulator n=1 Tax=Exilibacterium tricleocarpae TaxID=2591008 RepID=A0A545TAJ5_9GAMM|nr:nickel-responsive transcriptional regulator NikR [Exilibacterium tricleocarpae]TQV74241.1 nickel-responsive transcriptional regulator NikR [Exilibacterium tricleocarpae]
MNSQAPKPPPSSQKVSRISISLPEELLGQFDGMVLARGFESRSQAICDMINQQLNDHRRDLDGGIMAGTINLVYNHAVIGVQKKLHDLQYEYIDEVISTLNVNLTHTNTLSVVLVQGPAVTLKTIADKMITQRGVITGKLLLSSAIMPPLHPLPAQHGSQT